tara:strand:- start:10 stop:444 length:435 start_codon:yes stop_codon:yes gene_type:complete
MKKIIFLIVSLYFINFAKADSNISLKEYLEKKNIEEGSTQIYLLNRCSTVYAYASGIILKTDAVSSKNFIEISNNLLFKSIELMVIEDEKKIEGAQKKSEENRKKLFNNYIADGKKNWEKNKSHFKGSYISGDMTICSKLIEDK